MSRVEEPERESQTPRLHEERMDAMDLSMGHAGAREDAVTERMDRLQEARDSNENLVSPLCAMPEDDLLLQASRTVSASARPSWGAWALSIAEAVASRADCSRRQVGAVILDGNHHVVSTGYNGYPAGRPGCLSASACPRGRLSYAEIPKDSPYVGTASPCDALHAEENAILHAYRDLEGCTLYVTHEPCPNCSRLLDGTNLLMVVWPDGWRFVGKNAEYS